MSDAYLSESFLRQYDGMVPRFKGPLFEVVYLRTYSRWIDKLSRRETWQETVARVVEYSMKLSDQIVTASGIKEAEVLFDKMFHLKLLPAGRTLWIGGTKAAEQHPEANFNCFVGSEKFLTSSGYRSFDSFSDGEATMVMVKQGGWRDAIVKQFGEAEIVNLTLRKGSRTLKTIATTANHRWLVRKWENDYHTEEKTTAQLEKGDLIPEVRSQITWRNLKPCSVAIQHGIVFGDGTFVKKTGSCRIDLQADSRELESHFSTGTRLDLGSRGGSYKAQTTIDRLPHNWKEFPALQANKEYLLGFMMGWFAADGTTSGGTPTLASASKENLEWAKSALALVGIYSGNIQVSRTESPFDGSERLLYRLAIPVNNLTEDFFLRSKSREDFEPSKRKDLQSWVVESVVHTGVTDKVWCVQEPDTQTFVLEDGILTRNCAFLSIDHLECFGELFHLLLCGCGVGFSVMPEDVAKLPQMYPKTLQNKIYRSLPKAERAEVTDYVFLNGDLHLSVGDSKEAWVEALNVFLNTFTTDTIKRIFIDYDSIRPAGERIETFGGKAAGPDGMMDMFTKVTDLLNSKAFLTSVDCMDLCNLIAKNVIVGGTRRSSEIALGHVDDTDFIDAKLPDNFAANVHRAMSNNSICFTQKPRLSKLLQIFENIHENGEPGFFNLQAAEKRRPNAKGVNPCGEILLNSRGFCNLSTVVMTSHISDDGYLDIEDLLDSMRLVARIGMRLTNVTVSNPKWDKVQKEERLIGTSLTGWMDMLEHFKESHNGHMAINVLTQLRETANNEADVYSKELGIPRPLLVTTVKPEGTLSQLPTVSSGLHRSYAPFYIRRIRVSKIDAVAMALIEKGVPYVVDPHKNERLVFEFPIKTSATISSNQEPALEQFDRYLTFQKHYTDHNSSCTLTIERSETDEVVKRLHDEWDNVIGCAWLTKTPGSHPLMPYEECSEEEYERRAVLIQSLDDLHVLVNQFELAPLEEELEEDPACANGVCPVR